MLLLVRNFWSLMPTRVKNITRDSSQIQSYKKLNKDFQLTQWHLKVLTYMRARNTHSHDLVL